MPKSRRRYSRRHGLGSGAGGRLSTTRLVVIAAALLVSGYAVVVAVQVRPAERVYGRSADQSFVAMVVPIADESNDTGEELSSMLGVEGVKFGTPTLMATLDTMLGDAKGAVSQFESLKTPSYVSGAASSCLQALRTRADTLGSFRSAIASLLQAPDPGAATAIQGLGTRLIGSDRSWSDCRDQLRSAPGLELDSVPASAWVGAQTLWDQVSVESFVSAVSESGPDAGHPIGGGLEILAVSVSPPAEITRAGFGVLPTTTSIELAVIVEGTGTMPEPHVNVTASLVPEKGHGEAATETATTSVGPGLSVSVHPPALEVLPGASYLLEVSASPAGSDASSKRTYRISVASASGLADP
jgi:hypothetical protein